MLIGLSAPTSFFKPFNSIGLNELFPNTKKQSDAVDNNTLPEENVRSASPVNLSTYTTKKVSSSLNIFSNITAEQLVDKILNPDSVDEDNNFEKNYNLNLNIDYKAKLVEKRVKPETSGSGQARTVVTSKKTVKKYWAGYMVQSHYRDRDKQVNMFFNQTEKTVSKINTVKVDNYRSVRNKVAARFKYNLNLDFSFLAQFNNQTQALDGMENNELDGYLNTTDKLLDSSAELTKAFFNTVDAYLDDTKERLIGRVEEFFNDLRQATGKDIEQFENDKELMIGQINEFFGNVQKLLDNAEETILDQIGGESTPVLETDTIDENTSAQKVKNTTENTVKLNSPPGEAANGLPVDNHEQKQAVDTVA
jgi:hypothetical protein